MNDPPTERATQEKIVQPLADRNRPPDVAASTGSTAPTAGDPQGIDVDRVHTVASQQAVCALAPPEDPQVVDQQRELLGPGGEQVAGRRLDGGRWSGAIDVPLIDALMVGGRPRCPQDTT